MPLLAYPFALFGLLAVPLLAAIYLFRNRSKPTVVSSLMLWQIARRPKEGGRKISRLHTSWLFVCELLAILLFVAAAVSPLISRRNALHKSVVILDDSFSMLARTADGSNPCEKAKEALLKLAGQNNLIFQFMLAREEPRLLGREVSQRSEILRILRKWKCQAAESDLQGAIARAETLAPGARILVLTDGPAPVIAADQQIWWQAFGTRIPNIAIINAHRSSYVDHDRVLLEIKNFSEKRTQCTCQLLIGQARGRVNLELGPGQRKTVIRKTERQYASIAVSLNRDALAIDNYANLLPTTTPRVRVHNDNRR